MSGFDWDRCAYCWRPLGDAAFEPYRYRGRFYCDQACAHKELTEENCGHLTDPEPDQLRLA